MTCRSLTSMRIPTRPPLDVAYPQVSGARAAPIRRRRRGAREASGWACCLSGSEDGPVMGSALRAEALSPQTTSRPLRAWQQAALAQYEEQSPKDFLVTATPGAGKTTFALTLAARLLARREVARVVVVCPTDHLRLQWADAADAMGIVLDPGPDQRRRPGARRHPGLRDHLRAGRRQADAARRPRHRRQDAGDPRRGAPRRRRPLLGRGGRGGLRVRRPPAVPDRDAVPHQARRAHPLRPLRGGQLRGRRRRGRRRPGQPRRLHLRLQGGAGRHRRPAGRLRRLHRDVALAELRRRGRRRLAVGGRHQVGGDAGLAHGAGPQGPVGAARHRRDGRPDHAPARDAACPTPPG